MNPITDELVRKSNGLLKTQPEINDWTGKQYLMFNTGSVEVDTAEFLYAWVRLLKPQRILDTGTHFGVSALYMALGCLHNGFGQVLTLEHDETYIKEAKPLWQNCGLSEKIVQYHGSSLDRKDEDKYEFMLLDTEPQIRFAELIKYEKNLQPGGYVFIHDLHRHMSQEPNEEHGFGFPYGILPPEFKQLVKNDVLRPFHFATPRGLTGFYKTHEGDYKWL